MAIPSEKQSARFERGFKTWAENTSLAVRSRLKLGATDPLSYLDLAKHLGVIVWELSDIETLPEESLEYLSSSDGNEWSAVTVSGTSTVVVINPTHSAARKASSGMHELAHVIRGHEPSQVTYSPGGITFRDYNSLQEAEADWLAGCLLLPRTVLQHCYSNNFSSQDVRRIYSASSDLYNYRLQITGVTRQFSRRKKRATSR